jgi:cell division septation protein DedD
MNDTRALADGLASLRGRDPAWADVLEGMADLGAGRLDSAATKLGRAVSSAADPRAMLAAAWGLAECARLGGNPAAAAAARSELARKFPGSPEAALADGRVAPLPSPSQFAGTPAETTGSAPAAPAAAPGPAGVTFAVQAGSFGTRENADYLAADLAKKGFAAVVRGETREGRQVFKVFAAVGLARQAAEAVAAELSKSGFAGFVISETR